jgi:hypothetical protein
MPVMEDTTQSLVALVIGIAMICGTAIIITLIEAGG